MIIDINRIKHLLFDDAITKQRIEKDYGFTNTTTDIESFSNTLISSLDQRVKDIDRDIPNKELFEAAVKSLGSNSRSWATFISKEPELRNKLFNYEPRLVYENRSELQETLREFFPGQSCTNDVKAVLFWSEKLSSIENYYAKYIKVIMNAFRTIYKDVYQSSLKDELLFISVAGFFANPPTRWQWENYIGEIDLKIEQQNLNFYGMGFPLASEFLRNLGWNGFKPDRHIKRLFDYWNLPEVLNLESEVNTLLELSGKKNKELNEYIKYSLIGLNITPKDLSFSEVDNFIWASGAYVLKKGKESLLRKEELFLEEAKVND